jgi:hypothetical protein
LMIYNKPRLTPRTVNIENPRDKPGSDHGHRCETNPRKPRTSPADEVCAIKQCTGF